MTARERLAAAMNALGLEPKRSLGQNFLVSDSAIEKIIKAAARFQPRTLLEIGPGLGALTEELTALTDQLVLLELDRRLVGYWRERGFQVIETDALKWHWSLEGLERPVVLVSNLPYQISSSLVIDRSMDAEPLDGMVLMFQKEVAQRIKAPYRSEAYGFLSVVAQSFWDIDFVLEAGPREFSPAPKVASRVLSFNPRRVQISDRRHFVRFVKACFLHPRKLMVSNLVEGFASDRGVVTAELEAMKVAPKVRAEELSISQFHELYHRLGGRQGG